MESGSDAESQGGASTSTKKTKAQIKDKNILTKFPAEIYEGLAMPKKNNKLKVC